MSDLVIGGDHCRHIPKEDFPRRKVQIAIEKLEEAIGEVCLTILERTDMDSHVTDIRYWLDIPRYRLYSKALDDNALAIQIKIFPGRESELRKKNEEMKKLDEYNPSAEKRARVLKYVEEIRAFIRINGRMTKKVEDKFFGEVLKIVYSDLELTKEREENEK